MCKFFKTRIHIILSLLLFIIPQLVIVFIEFGYFEELVKHFKELLLGLSEIGILGILVFFWEKITEKQKEEKEEIMFHEFTKNEWSNILIVMKPFFRVGNDLVPGEKGKIIRDVRKGNSMNNRLEDIKNEFDTIFLTINPDVKIQTYLFSKFSNEEMFFNVDEINRVLTKSLFALKNYGLNVSKEKRLNLHKEIEVNTAEIIKYWLSVLACCDMYERKYKSSLQMYPQYKKDKNIENAILYNIEEAKEAYEEAMKKINHIGVSLQKLHNIIN